MPRSRRIKQRGPKDNFLSSHAIITETKKDHFSTLPPEVRCLIYKALFGKRCILRRVDDAKARNAPYITPFDNSILRTCKTFYTEALPIFYASQTFHFPAELDSIFRENNILQAHLGLVKNISIEVTVHYLSFEKLDSIVAKHVDRIIEHCTKLSTFTLHIIPATRPIDEPLISQTLVRYTFTKSTASKALKTLLPRLQSLSMVNYGNWHDLHYFREAIACDDQWVEGARCDGWPGLRLSMAQAAAVYVKQRRYTTVVSPLSDVVHPHKYCIRIFHAYGPKVEQRSKVKGD